MNAPSIWITGGGTGIGKAMALEYTQRGYRVAISGRRKDRLDEAKKEIYARLLARAYQDFVESDALTEKVFKVFHMNEPQETFVSLDSLHNGPNDTKKYQGTSRNI